MAANTITGYQALFKVAEETGELRAGYVTASADTTHATVGSLATNNSDNAFNTGLMRLQGSTATPSVISTYTGSTGAFVLATALTGLAVGVRVEWAWWDGNKYGKAWEAINQAILAAWPYWYQETITTQATSTVTLAAGTDLYDLSAVSPAVDGIIRVGVQSASGKPITWYDQEENLGDYGTRKPRRPVWKMEGQAGAYSIRFLPSFSREGTFADAFTGQKLCLWYATREPVMASEAGTTQLVKEYFVVAAEIYRRRELNLASRIDLITANVNVPQIQQVAQAQLAILGIGKRPLNELLSEITLDKAQDQVDTVEVVGTMPAPAPAGASTKKGKKP